MTSLPNAPRRARRVARERRHTLYFLDVVRPISPVFLDTEVDMTAVTRHRSDARLDGWHYSYVTYVLHTAGRVLARFPEANAAMGAGPNPRVRHAGSADGKLTLDAWLRGRRVVLSAVLPGLHEAPLDAIQRMVDHYRDGDPETMPEFAGVRMLHRMPWPVGRLLFRLRVRPLRTRRSVLGTFAVTSLGHRAVDAFHSVGGTTITLGLGRVADRPVVRDGRVAIAATMRLSLAFDHRVIDGAEAADVLTAVKDELERFGSGEEDGAAPAVRQAAVRPGGERGRS